MKATIEYRRASGGAKRHQPSDFLRADGVQAFIAAIDAEAVDQQKCISTISGVCGPAARTVRRDERPR